MTGKTIDERLEKAYAEKDRSRDLLQAQASIFNDKEWDIICRCKKAIAEYKANKGNRNKRRLYEEAKKLWEGVRSGDYRDLPEPPNDPPNVDLGYDSQNKLAYGYVIPGMPGRVMPVRRI